MHVKLVLPGQAAQKPEPLEQGLEEFLTVEVLREQKVSAAGRGAPQTEQVMETALDTDLLELSWANGVKQWMSVAQLRADAGRTTERGASAAAGEVRVPLTARFSTPSRVAAGRGATDWVLKGLKVLRISPAEIIASKTAKEVVEYFEGRMSPPPGLYSLDEQVRPAAPAGGLDGGAGPLLVFIHGTASSTTGSFGRMAGTDEWAALRERYPGSVYGLQHHTLSLSPVQNAIDLARLLPEGATVHLVTHSRGGLVGELLCMGPLSGDDLKPFAAAGRDRDVKLLEELSAVLAEKRLNVERFVRVACPARGTTLASKRLDLYFSVLLNLIGAIPALSGNPIYSFVKATLLELAKRRTKPDELPGLEAMMPESPVIHLLNRPDLSTAADLAVIAGDVQGSGIFGNIKVFATDLFYWEDHDLVVNTSSMSGGLGRAEGRARLFLDRGPEVNHFSYFANRKTREQVLAMLTDTQEARPAAAAATRGPADRLNVRATRAGDADLPVVFLVPGIMGTRLKDRRGSIWLDYTALARGHMERLGIGEDGIQTDGLISSSYQRLTDYLQNRGYRVVPFPFDWRRPIEDAGRALGEAVAAVEAELPRPERSVRIIAHSMGGLVARSMIADDPARWERLCNERAARLVMLGTPNLGSYAIPRLLLGREKILRQLALLDFRHRLGELVDIIRRFPGILQMMPHEDAASDFFDPAWWSRLPPGFAPPDLSDLRAADALRQKLKGASVPRNSCYVAGVADSTPSAVRLGDDNALVLEGTPDGDGRVPYAFGPLPGMPTWYTDAQHGDLANHPPAFAALVELIETGKTTQLAAAPPRRQRGAAVAVAAAEVMRDDEPLLFPTEGELVRAALGGEPEAAEARAEEPHTLTVSVAHGDLRLARYPLAVGHYRGDTVVHAEKALDRQLGGRLTHRFNLYLYPGPVGTTEVIRDTLASPPGALVIGLGEVGEITPAIVRRGVTSAALRNALAVFDESRALKEARAARAAEVVAEGVESVEGSAESGARKWVSAGFSSLLLGTYGGNALDIGTSVAAIVEGAIQANLALRAQGLWDEVRVDEVQIVELYEDVAIEAVHAAVRLAEHPPATLTDGDVLAVSPPRLHPLGGGLLQRPLNPYVRGWWRRVQVTGEGGKRGERGLRFLALTDRARAEDTLQHTQQKFIDKAVERAVGSPAYDDQLAVTLFKLLIPNTLKERVGDETGLVLVLDRVSAQYPWELLAERTSDGVEPFAVRSGLIRQFKTSDYRPSPQPARERRALVVGVPKLSPSSTLPDLPGARDEALRVAEVLAAAEYRGWGDDRLVALTDADPLEIVGKLFARDYKILHLAGHGLYDPQRPDESGLVLDEGMYLTSKELCNLNPVPELVFINCCHLGKMDKNAEPTVATDSPHRLAASISQELIQMGVKAVVAAGWAVDDLVAVKFAETFYERMLRGEKFGTAVREARAVAHDFAPESNTWGAYQCYGNPDFVLQTVGGSSEGERKVAEMPLSRRECLQSLMDVAADATRARGEEEKAQLRARLEQLGAALPDEWRDGEVLSAFGAAWGALGDYGLAAGSYEQAINEMGARAPFKAVEQYALMLVRGADKLRGAGPGAGEPAGMIDQAVGLLEWLGTQLQDSTERLTLTGGCYKRKATAAATAADRRKWLGQAMGYYRRAHELNAAAQKLDPYPTLNWLTYKVLLGEPLDDADIKLVVECREAGVKAKKGSPTFWNRVAEPDAELLVHLSRQDLGANLESVRRLYQRAFDAGASQFERSTVLEHLDFLTEMSEAAAPVAQGAKKGSKGGAKKGSKKGARKGQKESPNVAALRKLRAALCPPE
ncbi:MAG: CHAT domain-containing protein [Pyrinomonadaceae bacterium]